MKFNYFEQLILDFLDENNGLWKNPNTMLVNIQSSNLESIPELSILPEALKNLIKMKIVVLNGLVVKKMI